MTTENIEAVLRGAAQLLTTIDALRDKFGGLPFTKGAPVEVRAFYEAAADLDVAMQDADPECKYFESPLKPTV